MISYRYAFQLFAFVAFKGRMHTMDVSVIRSM